MEKPRRSSFYIPTGRSLVFARRPAGGVFLSAALTVLLVLMWVLPPSLGASSDHRTDTPLGPAISIPTSTPGSGDGAPPTSGPATSAPRRPTTPPTQAARTAIPAQACAQSSTIAPAAWQVLVCDGFDDNADNRWQTGIINNDFAISSRSVVDGKYRWQQKALQGFSTLVKYLDYNLTDFFVAVDVRLLDGPQNAQYGLSFRQVDSHSYYTFNVDDQSRYRLDVLINDEWSTLIDWTDSPEIKPGQSNRLAVKGESNQFTFYINDRRVADFTDDKLAQGVVGISTDMEDSGAEALFEFDNFEIRAPAGSAATATSTPRATRPPRTATPPPTPTPTPTESGSLGWCDDDFDIAPLDWSSTLCGAFSARDEVWSTGPDDSDYARITRTVVDGVYTWKIDALQDSNVFSVWYGSRTDSMSDVFVAVDARRTDSSSHIDAAYGLHFRKADSNNFYDFKVDDATQEFKIQVLVDNHWTTLTDWTESDAISSGEWNRLSALAEGNQLTFWINGEQVAQLTDDHLSQGQVGLEASVYDAGPAAIEFNNFSVWTP